jgi:hypothetical protein
MRIRILACIFIFFLFACASKVYVKTEFAPKEQIPHDATFCIFVLDQNTIEEQKALQSLETKLKNLGYQTTRDPAEYWFAITMDTPSYSSTFSMPITSPSTTKHSGYVGNTYYSGTSTSSQTTYIPMTSRHSFKKNYLTLYKYNFSTKNSRIIWSSFTSIDSKEYKSYEDQIMEIVIGLLGKDFEGNIRLKR